MLASASPRRAALLTGLGVSFETASVEIDERSFERAGDATASVEAIAAAKFAAFDAADTHSTVTLLTADTLVACAGEIMGKPDSEALLTAMLGRMAGQALSIVTALCLGSPGSAPTGQTVTTTVRLRSITDAEIADYVRTGVGMDKAGGLALQAEAGAFIESVDGCWSNVLGLPVCAVAAGLGLPPGGDQRQRCSVELCSRHR